MEFKYIDDVFSGISLDLEILKRKTQKNSILLYQHEGQLLATLNSIGNASNVNDPFLKFFEMAKVKDVDLALTPEYSCPWEVITNIINDNQSHPSMGKLWVIGCESNSLNNLSQFKQDYENEFITIYYDNELNENSGSFVDPVVYIFKSNINDEKKLTVLIQFKTRHMGVWGGGEIERDNIILGREIYVFRNTPTSIYLMTIICSEAMNFKDTLNEQVKQELDWLDKPYLILHPQFNPKPNHSNFIDFRKFVFLHDHKEIISLNWQLNSKVSDQELLTHKSSRSGFYIKSTQLNLNKQRINNNHL